MAAFDGAYQHAELCGVGGIAPTEIVEDGGTFDVSTDGGEVAQGFIYGVHGHPVGVDYAIQRVDAVGKDDTGARFFIKDGLQDCGIAWAVAGRPYQWFKDGCALYFVVVAAHDGFFRGDGGVTEEG